MNLFVGNVDFRVSESELRQRFEDYGEVTSCRIVTDRETGRSRGFAFVEMASDDEGNAAIQALHGASVGQRELNVSEARPRPEGGGGGGGGGRGDRDGGNRGGGGGGGYRR